MNAFPETKRAWSRLKAAWADYRLARRQSRAIRKLERLVAKRKASFECQDYARRRASALKATRKVEAC